MNDKERLAKAIDEIVGFMVQIESMREHIKEVKKMIKDEFGLPLRETGKLAKIRYKRNLKEVVEETEELERFYHTLFESEGRAPAECCEAKRSTRSRGSFD